ncbi:pilus assembly PilX N-terminal domain-containing protein [Nitrospira lenta]|uniref:Putative Type IV pilus assembly protein PilX n=1 Tax=Nitrospira lenta TaxID=1436998 RepID=A0A330L501_9BACT|nr:pilus assembly PilX N-terminal domain-containing protein [Nitrospira lenta]SPP64891.1 putative Type IV pilus assembly protein PilX [Nitrospira lenta]
MLNWHEVLREDWLCSNERGTSFMTVMLLLLITGSLGVAALTMSGLENSMAGSLRVVEEGAGAAESCVGTAVRAIRLTMDDPEMDDDALVLIAPLGPVPALNKLVFSQEINGTIRNSTDVPVGAGNAPNLTMNVNNYIVNGDIDFLYGKQRADSNIADPEESVRDFFYRVDCVAANASTGAMSRVIATFACYSKGVGCQKRGNT